MSLWAKCVSLAGSLSRRRRMEREMQEEMQFHLASHVEQLVRSGMSPRDAERMARVEFGSGESLKEECRQALGLRLADEAAQDLRYAARMLRTSPGFAALAVVTLAVGIGLNTAIFSVLNAFLLKPMPYRDPDRLVAIWTMDAKRNLRTPAAAADLYDWRQWSPAFEEICGWNSPLFTLMRGDEPVQVAGARVSAEFFHMLGVTPQAGRDFASDDDRPGAPRVALLSDDLWHEAFAGDAGVIGRNVQLNGLPATVIGIMPRGFHLALMGRVQVWVPLALNLAQRADRSGSYLNVIGRIKPGLAMPRAAQSLQAVADRLAQTYAATNAGRSVAMATLQDEIAREAGKEPALICFGLVGCVLLLACANVANLIVGRALGRQQEMAVRLGIGAGRWRLMRQLLTENLLLFVLAGVLSLALAVGSIRWIEGSLSYEIRGYLPNGGVFPVDVTTLLYALGVAVATGLVFGFAPAVHCWRMDVMQGLRGSSPRASGGPGGTRLKSVLVVLEMAMALVVVVASGLMAKGMVRMYAKDQGLDVSGLVTARVLLSDAKYSDLGKAQAFYDGVLERVRQLPGVKAVGAAQFVPYDGNGELTSYAVEGQSENTPGRASILFDPVTPEYLAAAGIPLMRGRLLTEQDRGTELVGVINQTMARRHWPGGDAIGRRIRFGPKLARTVTIVGVAQDVPGQTDTGVPQPQIYVPVRQAPSRGMTLVIRTEAGVEAMPGLYAALRRAARGVDAGQAIYRIATMEDLRSDLMAPTRVAGQMTMLLGAVSVFLAAIGIYGVMSYAVATRRKEFGIRMALGAGRKRLLIMAAAQGMKPAAFGFALGLAGALAATRFMTSVLYHVSPTDLPTFATTSLLMVAVAALGCYVPARQASGADPLRALHHE